MSDTYARVMRASEGPADRRTTRSRAPRRPGAMRDPVAGNPAMTGVVGGGAPAVAQAAGPESPAEATFAAAVAAFTAARAAQRRRGPAWEGGPAPEPAAPVAIAHGGAGRRG